VTQYCDIVCDQDDPFPEGYTVGDIWCWSLQRKVSDKINSLTWLSWSQHWRNRNIHRTATTTLVLNSLESRQIQHDREIDSNGPELRRSQDDMENKSFIFRKNLRNVSTGYRAMAKELCLERSLTDDCILDIDWLKIENERELTNINLDRCFICCISFQIEDVCLLCKLSSKKDRLTKSGNQSGVEGFNFHQRILNTKY
jgi:hypothetical protein